MVKEGVVSIPDGKPKSGRVWKIKQKFRSSVQQRSGVLSHLNKSFEEKQAIRAKKASILQLEREMKDEKKQKLLDAKIRREEQQKRRMANEYKNSVYQELKHETLKGMSKKQLRMVKKTAINKNGQVELVSLYGNDNGNADSKKKKRKG